MPLPQSGIIPEPNASALFLVLGVRDRNQDGSNVARGLAATPSLLDQVRGYDEQAGLVCTVDSAPGSGK